MVHVTFNSMVNGFPLPEVGKGKLSTAMLVCALAMSGCGGGGDAASQSATMGTSQNAQATNSSATATDLSFRNRYTSNKLTINNSGSGNVTSQPSGINCGTLCTTSVAYGTSVKLTATPSEGHVFSNWGGSCSGTSTTCTVAMSSAKSVSATFAVQPTAPSANYTLTVTDVGTGSGTVVSSTGGISCSSGSCTASIAAGTNVILTATPGNGFAFAGWSGACSGAASTCTVTMSAAESATATFATTTTGSGGGSGSVTATCAPTASSATLAVIATNSSGSLSTNQVLNSACSIDTAYGSVNGACYGSYAIQSNAYGTPPANTSFSMWANGASCWGINVTEPTDPNFVFWNAPEATRGFSFGVNSLLTSTGGVNVSALNAKYASASTPCPATGASQSVCAKWSMSVPGVAPQSAANTGNSTYGQWNALLDIYFHTVAKPSVQQNASFDLQIYQMVMDYTAGGSPNWATYLLGTYTTKTIGGITYLVSVNMQDPGTEGSTWVGYGGSNNTVAMFPLPTYPTSGSTGSYLWGQASMTHDVGGVIAWLSQPQTINGVTGIFDDAGRLLYDNVRKASVKSALINPSSYLTGLNAGYEVTLAVPNANYPNNTVFTTTNYWVALPGETVGN